MYLSLATTHQPATDLGYLLMKHPDRLHEVDLAFGKALAFFPEAGAARCECALVLDVDAVGLVRGKGAGAGLLDHYVNDRPYAASSFLSVALARVFRTAMAGTSRERQALADVALPLEISITPLPVRGEDDLVRRLFEPLGWQVDVARLPRLLPSLVPAEDRASRYVTLKLAGLLRLAEALTHLYVLIPVLDNDKHYWIGDDEVEKLLAKGGTWLVDHPERELITRRYLKSRRRLVREALARLAPDDEGGPAETRGTTREEALEAPIRLHDLRLDTVAQVLAEAGAAKVADLGCGEGKLIERLMRDRRFAKIFGLDASVRSLERAAERLRLERFGAPTERVELLHGALTYRDARWHEADAAALVEVIEHLDADRLAALADVVFGAARPRTVVVTTPNREYNQLFPTLDAGAFRHPDHRFEWTRAECRAWADAIEARFGYTATHLGIGDTHPAHGPITQMVVLKR